MTDFGVLQMRVQHLLRIIGDLQTHTVLFKLSDWLRLPLF